MTDFVLEQRMTSEEISKPNFYDIQTHICKYYDKVFSYANFLKQPLTLGMFVPCDLDGNVLEKPCDSMQIDGCRDCACREYLKAKERVVFKVEYKIGIYNKKPSIWINRSGAQIIDDFNFLTIEDLVHWNFELTDSAIKQIGL